MVDQEEIVKQSLIDQSNRYLWKTLNISHTDFAESFKKYASSFEIEKHLKQMKLELDQEIWSNSPIPEELTESKAAEIKEYAEKRTNEAIQSVMN